MSPEEEALRRALAAEMGHGQTKPAPELPMMSAAEEAAFRAVLQEKEKRSEASALPALGYGFMKGLTRGGDDELAAYFTDANVEETRANRREAAEGAPMAGTVGELAGAFLGGVLPMAATLRGMRGAGLGAQMAVGGGVGAGEAVTQGFLQGEGGFVNRLKNAYNPLAISVGAGVGAAVPAASRVAGLLAGRTVRAGAANTAGVGMSRPAASKLLRRFNEDDEVRNVRAYLDELGPNATLADAGPSLRGMAGGGASYMGPARPAIVGAMEARTAAAPDRLATGIDNILGPRMDMTAARESLRAAQSREARDAWSAFNATNVPLTPDLRAMIRQADDTGALAYTRQVAAARGVDFDPATYLSPNATEISGEALDLISRALRDRSRAAWRNGEGALGEALGDLNRRFVDLAPGLSGIRRRYADQMSIREAAEEGGDLLNGRVSADAFRARWAELSEAERAAFRASARDAIEQKMANSAFEANAGLRALGPRAVQDKINIAFGDGAAFDIDRLIRSERVMRDTANRTVANSETAGRLSAQKDFAPPVTADGLPPGPINAAKGALGAAWQAGKESFAGATRETVSRDLARALTATGPERDRIVAALIRDQLRGQNRAAVAGNIEDLTRLLLSGGAAPAAALAN